MNMSSSIASKRDAPHLTKAKTIAEALPFMQKYAGKAIVIKYGGNAMGNPEIGEAFASDIVLLKQAGIQPIVVHGGGPQIGNMLEKLAIKSEFAGGLRITDKDTVEVVEMVLSGMINKQLVSSINRQGGRAIGLSGKDGNLTTARKVFSKVKDEDSNIENVVDIGFVGEPHSFDLTMLNTLLETDLIPVIAPVAADENGQTYNINADSFAGKLAEALHAKRLLLLTNVSGVLDKEKKLILELDVKEAHNMIATGEATGGMIPKLQTCISAVENGTDGVVILDGEMPHAVLGELLTNHGVGTLIYQKRT